MSDNSLRLKLLGELGQTERSAARHCGIEADRLKGSPPGAAMQAVSDQAKGLEKEIDRLCEARDVKAHTIGAAIGNLFSIGRDQVADLMLRSEQSYRGTLLGMRHGRDLVELLRLASTHEGDAELAAWCKQWLVAREPLIAACSTALSWFAEHQDEATSNSKLT